MAGTTISSSVTVGVTLTSATQNPVTVTSAGKVSVTGTKASAIYGSTGVVGHVTNSGTLTAVNGYGVKLHWGGSVTNGSTTDTTALISGGIEGVRLDDQGARTLTNYGTVSSTNIGVYWLSPSAVTNGSTADTVARITGQNDGVCGRGTGTVTNFAIITATGAASNGVYLLVGGSVTNGSATDTSARISGNRYGVRMERHPGTVTNYGTINALNYGLASGITLGDGGIVTNGSASDTTASILGLGFGVSSIPADRYMTGTVSNFGTIRSMSSYGDGILFNTATITNGSATDRTATITGAYDGITIFAGTVVNYGTITGTGFGALGVILGGIGTITNGNAADTKALIAGSSKGIYGDDVVVTNFGTVMATPFFGSAILHYASAIAIKDGGSVTNGSAADSAALIAGSAGVHVSAGATITNYGKITGSTYSGVEAYLDPATITNLGTISSAKVSAIKLTNGGVVTNGGTAYTTAAILGASGGQAISLTGGIDAITNYGTLTGGTGVQFATGATGTVVNAGKIVSTTGSTGTAISFSTGTNLLVVDPGASFTGNVTTGGGTDTLELAGTAAGTFSGLGSQFTGFGTVTVDGGAAWTLTGANTAATVDNLGTLILAASASLDVTGTVATASTGTFELNTSSILTIAADPAAGDKMQFLGSGELVVANASSFGLNVGTPSYTGPLIENFVAGDAIDLANVLEAGAVLNYSTATGLLQVTDGSVHLATLAFQNATLGLGSFHPGSDGSGHLLITHS